MSVAPALSNANPAATWPAWTDRWVYEPTPPPAPLSPAELRAQVAADLDRLDALDRRFEAIQESFHPVEAFEPSAEDLADCHAADGRITDSDVGTVNAAG
jgi:hypothetical protein